MTRCMTDGAIAFDLSSPASPRIDPLPRMSRHRLDRDLAYYVDVPPEVHADTPVIVSIHGISRNADVHVAGFQPHARRHGAIIIAPLFPGDRFSDYQRLGRAGRGERADLGLDAVLLDVSHRHGVDCQRFFLAGYSGGAQFAHRYALAYPARIRKLALCAAGWYTFPNPMLKYPHGTRRDPKALDVSLNLAAFLRIPTLVMVGEKDVTRGKSLNRSPRVDENQGRTRRERAQNWVEAIQAAQEGLGLKSSVTLKLLKDRRHVLAHSHHVFSADFAAPIVKWFFDEQTD